MRFSVRPAWATSGRCSRPAPRRRRESSRSGSSRGPTDRWRLPATSSSTPIASWSGRSPGSPRGEVRCAIGSPARSASSLSGSTSARRRPTISASPAAARGSPRRPSRCSGRADGMDATFLWRRHRADAVVLARKSGMLAGEDFITYHFAVEVRPAGAQPFRAEAKYPFLALEPKPDAGDVIRVRYGRSRSKVSLDLAGDPRYDGSARRKADDERFDAALKP